MIVFSGIQPTGDLHIGNYLGAVKNWVELQNSGEYDCYFCIVDLHSLVGNQSAEELRERITNTAAELFALGLDPDKSTVFVQSHVQEHTELAWMFNTLTPVTELERMTQFKDKSSQQAKNINAGLFTYPVLQAADILLYKGTHVPVGEDQKQHIELTRDIARWFNNKYGEFFPETEALITEMPRVKGLLHPEKKMSKSLEEGNSLFLKDDPEILEKKVKKSVTATEGDAPGVQNLMMLLKEFGDSSAHHHMQQMQADGTLQFGELKAVLAEAVATYFAAFRRERAALLQSPELIAEKLSAGAASASKIAQQTMAEVRKMVGIR